VFPLVLLIFVRVPLETYGRHPVDASTAASCKPYECMAGTTYRSSTRMTSLFGLPA
jgi:hypothetical protein